MRFSIACIFWGCFVFSAADCRRPAPPPTGQRVTSPTSPTALHTKAPLVPRPTLRASGRGHGSAAPQLMPVSSSRLLADAPPLPGQSSAAKDIVAPLSLTASDGTGLRLQRLEASAVVQGVLAFTELHLTFENPEPRQIEGHFSIVLPPGAAVSRFAMLLENGWQEAEVVERQAARRAYEDFLHRRQDPALLEHEAGNQFSARVFPIPASGKKEIKISYSQELVASETSYRLPLAGLPQLAELDVTAIVGQEVTSIVKRDYRPEHDLQVLSPSTAAGKAVGLRSDNLIAARVRIGESSASSLFGGAASRADLSSLLLLFDTSASRAAGFETRLQELSALLTGLGQTGSGSMPLIIGCFDQAVEEVYKGPLSGFSPAVLERIRRRAPLGASNLQEALRFAAVQKGISRVLLLTDGVVTAGAADSALGEAINKLGDAGVQRLDAVLSGGIRDEAAMARLVSGHLAQDGAVIDGSGGAEHVLRKLQRATLSGVQVAVAGARWQTPQKLDGVQPGDEFIVYADFPEDTGAPQEVTVSLSGPIKEQQRIPLISVSLPLLERAYVRSVVANLEQSLGGLDAKIDKEQVTSLRQDIVTLSTRFRVLSDYTALLVLETEQDYARFGIDRKALADILSVGDHGIELLQRQSPILVGDSAPGQDKPRPNDAQTSETKKQIAKIEQQPTEDENQGNKLEEKRTLGDPQEAPAANARQQGVLGILSAPPGNIAQVFARDSAGGNEGGDAMGGLVGTEVGESYGAGGLGLVGSGRGGGGTGEGTMRLGNLGTIGRGSGASSGSYGSRSRAAAPRRALAPTVMPGTAAVQGSLDAELIRRIIRRHINEPKFCYERELVRNPTLGGRVMIQFTISSRGEVTSSFVASSTMANRSVEECVAGAVRRWQFPATNGGIVTVTYPFVFTSSGDVSPPPTTSTVKEDKISPYTGKLAEVMTLLGTGKREQGLELARAWRSEQPGDVMALLALGESLEAMGQNGQAARAYGSIIDLFPARADMRRFAGERLERLGDDALKLAADTFAHAVEQRPDHPSSHRLYAYALLRSGDVEGAFAAIEAGLKREYPSDRFRGVDRIMREDLGLIGAAWIQQAPNRRGEILERLKKLSATLAEGPSLRFVLNWETDANDVDFHIHDNQGGHAYYSQKTLPSGGELYADVTTGYGPECFTIPGIPKAFPYRLEAHYYSRGPMGYGMGKLEILQHDGKGNLKFAERPFVVMNDQAFVELGEFSAPL